MESEHSSEIVGDEGCEEAMDNKNEDEARAAGNCLRHEVLNVFEGTREALRRQVLSSSEGLVSNNIEFQDLV